MTIIPEKTPPGNVLRSPQRTAAGLQLRLVTSKELERFRQKNPSGRHKIFGLLFFGLLEHLKTLPESFSKIEGNMNRHENMP